MDIFELYPNASVLENDSYKPIIKAFEQHDMTCLTLMLAQSPDELSDQTGIPVDIMADFLEDFRHDVNQNVDIRPMEQCKFVNTFTTGDKALDKLLNGGICTRCITEIAGESGTGKSNLLTQLAISVQLPVSRGGLGKSAIYISTETGLETRRMFDMLTGIEDRYDLFDNIPSGDNIHCITTTSQDQLENLIAYTLPHIVEKYDSGLVIIDSIASHFRMENTATKESYATRRKSIQIIGNALTKLTRTHNVAVVCSNQVSERFIKEIDFEQPNQYTQMYFDHDRMMQKTSGWKQSSLIAKGSSMSPYYERKRVVSPSSSYQSSQEVVSSPLFSLDELASLDKPKTPFLGIQWTRMIDERIVLKRYNLPGGTRRTLEVVFSCQCEPGKMEFRIVENGVFMIVYE